MKVAVTGGAGFIGSNLVDTLVKDGHDVLVIDDFSSGNHINSNAAYDRISILDDLTSSLVDIETVFHLAADPDVRSSAGNPNKSFDINAKGTFKLLDSCRKADVGNVVFTSTSTVYGEAEVIPTPETHPCRPISNYGASKLSGEAYISSFSSTYGIRASSLRLANIFGERSTHGVMYDFYNKLNSNPHSLEILGTGKQDKSYLHVSDCISAILLIWEKQKKQYEIFNIGSREKHTVEEIARIESRLMGVAPTFTHTGEKRGWNGDVRLMLLDVSRMEDLGWKEQVSLEEGMGRYVRYLQSQ